MRTTRAPKRETMDCRTCQPTLIDLLQGELATDAAVEAQAHLKGCASCRSAFDKLSRGATMAQGLPLLEPPQAVSARLMQLAEEHASRAAALRRPERKPPRAWQSLLDFVGRFAMARQVGMATIMLLIVAVGLWSLPQLERAPMADGGTVVNPEPSGEAAPSTGVQPAEPLDLKVDLRAGRIRSKDEEQSAESPAAAPAAAQPALRESDDDAALATAKGERSRRAQDRALGDVSAPLEAMKSASKPRRRAESKSSGTGADSLAQLEGYGRADKTAGAGPNTPARAEEERAFPGSAAPVASPSAPPASSSARAPSRTNRQALGGALARAGASEATAVQDGPAPEAVAASAPAKRKAAADGLSDTAAATDCSVSLSRLQRTVDGSPESAEAGEALLAMARCRSQRGERALARTLLERAARNPHVATRAKALLGTQSPPAAAPAANSDPR